MPIGTPQRRFALTLGLTGILMIGELAAGTMTIDDRSAAGPVSTLGTEWRLVTDTVMGGVSQGEMTLAVRGGRPCVRMRGDVSTQNNGGFVQLALPLAVDGALDATAYEGVEIEVSGNGEAYNLHLRTDGLWLPWQSYRSTFVATADWQQVRIPFDSLEAYRTSRAFDRSALRRLGLVAIGRNFSADLCVAGLRLYGG